MSVKHFRLIAFTLLLATAAMDASLATHVGATDTLLKPPLNEDPRRALIQKVVRSRYPELFSSSAAPGWVAITLLINQDGRLFKGYEDETRPQPYTTAKVRAFEAMGVDGESYDDRVQLDMRGGTAGGTRIYVRAYFPKSRQPGSEGPAAPNDDPAVNRAIAEKYFPDLYSYTTPKNESVADFWVLLDRAGRVQATGRRYSGSEGDLKLFLESLYPGIRTDGFQPTELRSDHGRAAVVSFLWLAADSPVTNLSKADISKRSDVALYAEISGQGGMAETTLAVLKFGSPSVAVCDDKALNLQVIATDGGADAVILRARMQRVARAQPADFEFGRPSAVESAWPPESPPVRVRFGESADVQVSDQDHRTWKVVLHPDRMRGALSMQ